MIVLRILFFVLCVIDGIGALGMLVAFWSSLMHSSAGQSDVMIWLGLLLALGGAIALGVMLRRAGRPGLACLPLVLGLPLALYGIGIAAFVIAPVAHH